MNWLDKLERKFRNFGIKGLMTYIVGLNFAVFLLYLLAQNNGIVSKLLLIPALVYQGEIWRLISFIFIPPSFSVFWILFTLYFYYMIGNSLEHEWGTFKFNIFYLIGVLGSIAAAFISGGIGNPLYINLSLFLAFAYIYPNYQILIFFVLPVKVKYLAWIDAAFILYTVFTADLSGQLAAAAAFINFLLFFGKDIFITIKTGRQNYNRRKSYDVKLPKDYTVHKCEICGRTEKDNKELEFRYCVECVGDHEYCMEHLKSHEHVKI